MAKSKYKKSSKSKPDYAALVTEQVIKAVLAGHNLPWRCTWTPQTKPRNAVSGRPYTGINVWIATVAAWLGGFATGQWLTKSAMKQLGGWFRKGERPTWLWMPVKVKLNPKEDDPEGEERFYIRFKVFQVWNLAQCRDIPKDKLWNDFSATKKKPLAACEEIVAGYQNPPSMGKGDPAYWPKKDRVMMPDLQAFSGAPEYYAALFHELGHSTGHSTRLDRGLDKPASMYSKDYSKEELVAEFTATLLCGEAGIAPATIENQTAYVKHWLEALQNDPSMLAEAAGKAQKAADHILGK
jgi:antirestriction protein ArdC